MSLAKEAKTKLAPWLFEVVEDSELEPDNLVFEIGFMRSLGEFERGRVQEAVYAWASKGVKEGWDRPDASKMFFLFDDPEEDLGWTDESCQYRFLADMGTVDPEMIQPDLEALFNSLTLTELPITSIHYGLADNL